RRPGETGQPVALTVGGSTSPIAAIIYGGSHGTDESRLEIVNLKEAKSIASVPIAAASKQQLFLSPSAERLLVMSQGDAWDQYTRFEVWELSGKKPLLKDSWFPYPDAKFREVDVFEVEWLDDDQFLSM